MAEGGGDDTTWRTAREREMRLGLTHGRQGEEEEETAAIK
jgi:hypothetical protein